MAEDIGGAVEVIGNELTLPRSLKQNKKALLIAGRFFDTAQFVSFVIE